MPHTARFALSRKPLDPHDKPVVFETLSDLVATIHRDRNYDGLQFFDAEIEVFGETTPRPGVSVFAPDNNGGSRYLGWVYLEGRGAPALRRALEVARPDLPVIGQAA